jgi:hypothetical protein
VMLSAPMKTGKTTMMGNLVASLADGRRFLGQDGTSTGYRVTQIEPGRRIVLLDFEMTRRKLRAWLRDHNVLNTDAVHVELLRGATWDIRDDGYRAEWAAYLASLNAAVLILDPLGPILHSLNINENDNTEVGRVLNRLDALAVEAGIAELMIAHHAGHNGERSRGASVLRGWPDAEWRIVREDAGPGREPPPNAPRYFAAFGRDVSVPEGALSYDKATRRLTLGTGTRATAAVDQHRSAVVGIVTESPGLSRNGLSKEIVNRVGISKNTADKLITTLKSSGVLHVHPGSNSAQHHYPGAACSAACVDTPKAPRSQCCIRAATTRSRPG